ncbi:hypothetical protein Tco_1303426 [Tanacetum coccineum]
MEMVARVRRLGEDEDGDGVKVMGVEVCQLWWPTRMGCMWWLWLWCVGCGGGEGDGGGGVVAGSGQNLAGE